MSHTLLGPTRRNLARRLSTLALVCFIAIGLNASPADAAPLPAQLSANQIDDRLTAIGLRYDEVGDQLNDEDAEFIRQYGTPATTARGTVSRSFTKQGSGAGGSANINGYMKLTNGPWASNSYSFTVNSSGSGRVTKVKTCGVIRAYGTIGSGGLGVVFKEDPCQTLNRSSTQMSRSRSYTALVAYSTITVYSDFTTSGGSFRIQS